MRKKILSILVFLACGIAAADVTIANKGRANADIVTGPNPPAVIRYAAEELKHHLDRMTGGNFIITEKSKNPVQIVLGQGNPDGLKRDGFVIAVKGGRVEIYGRDNPSAQPLDLFHLFYDETDRGTLMGVYEFLEQLGVRWPAPGPGNAYIPERATVILPEKTAKIEPVFADRTGTDFWNFMEYYPDAGEYCRNVYDMYIWGLRLKLSTRSMVVGCHSENTLKFREIWRDHPERFQMMPDGKRNFDYLCWTDPAVKDIWFKAADAYFSGKTPAEAGFPHLKPYLKSKWPFPFIAPDDFMIDPHDHTTSNDGRCRCPRCETFRQENPCPDDSEIIWRVIAGVAQKIGEKHPGKYISTLIYPPKMSVPKTVEIPDNVLVRVCISGAKEVPTPKRLQNDLDIVREWHQATGNKPPLWTYQCIIFDRTLPVVPEIYPRLTAEFLRQLKPVGAGAYIEHHAFSHTARNLDMYVYSRLLWNPDQDVDQILDEYYRIYYGPAAGEAKLLYERMMSNWLKIWSLTVRDEPGKKRGSVGMWSDRKAVQKAAWGQVYTVEEMQAFEKQLTALENAAAAVPGYAGRAGLLRKYLYNIMAAERLEAMDKAELQKDIILKVAANEQKAHSYPLISAARLAPVLSAGGEFKVWRDDGMFHLRADLKEPKLAASATKTRNPGDPEVWQDNDLELFFFSNGKLWQIIINDQGNWASQWITVNGAAWERIPGVRVKVDKGADAWQIHAGIPLSVFGGGKLLFNLARNRNIKGEKVELSTWSPLGMVGNWHDPENYGNVEFED